MNFIKNLTIEEKENEKKKMEWGSTWRGEGVRVGSEEKERKWRDGSPESGRCKMKWNLRWNQS